MNSSFLRDAAIIFDLDGTLVDTAPDLLRAVKHILDGLGCPHAPDDYMRPMISFGARRMIVEALKYDGRELTEEAIDEQFAKFLVYYADNVAVESRPFPHIVDFLESASRAGAKLGVCTNKREDLTHLLLKQLEMHRHFDAIVGRDTLDVYKPHPRHLTETISRVGGSVTRAVMIGDSSTDVNTAKAASIPVIAVPFGYSEIPAHELGADTVIQDYSELPGALSAILES